MLQLSHISKNYGKFCAVRDISLELEDGLYGMLAPNGAGKTTLIKMIVTLLYPTEGTITYDGIEIQKMGENYRDLIGYLPQQFGYYKNQSPVQYLNYLAALKAVPKEGLKEKIKALLELVGLSETADKKMKKFSGGMIQRVGIAQALLNDPKILILDEPTSLSRDRIVILSTHIVSDIESIANQVIMIKDKKLYRKDTVANICSELDGEIFECAVPEKEFPLFEKQYLVLGARQEHGYLKVRYYDPDGSFARAGKLKEEWKPVLCAANLEDVFLVSYGDEKTEVIL